jgi:hypothetical protein
MDPGELLSQGPFNETRLDRSTDKAQGEASMSSPAVAPEASPSQPLFEPSDGRIYPDEDKNPSEVNVGSKNGNQGNSDNPPFQYWDENGKRSALHLRRWQFNPETGKQASALGAKAIAAQKAAFSAPIPDKDPITQARLDLLKEQIASTRRELNRRNHALVCPHCEELIEEGRMSAKDRAQLLNALDRLLERERILRGIAAPAPFRAPRQTRQSSSNTAEPL